MKKSAWILILLALLAFATSCSTHRSSPRARHDRGEVLQPRSDTDALKHLPRQRRALIEEAMEWMGTPYKYAGQTKGVETDCSGFVMQVYLTVAEKKLPRNSAKQAEFCSDLRPGQVQPGDLVFFATGSDPGRVTHVGMMIDDVRFIHASASKGVVISTMDNNWYSSRLLKYGRVPGM